MQELIKLLRLKQLFGHNAHNTCARAVFQQDHSFFGEIYSKAEEQYDSVVERMIGLGQPLDLNQIQLLVAQELQKFPSVLKENSEGFIKILELNKQMLSLIEPLCKSGKLSQGSIQLIGEIGNQIEMENYKLGQRLKK